MTESLRLVEQLLARIADTERLARDAAEYMHDEWTATSGTNGNLHMDGPHVETGEDGQWVKEVPSSVWTCDDYSDYEGCADARAGWMRQAEHIARHDPAAVLRRCATDRTLVMAAADALKWVDDGGDLVPLDDVRYDDEALSREGSWRECGPTSWRRSPMATGSRR